MSEKKANLAIIGSGLAGLAIGFEYLQAFPGSIDFYRLPHTPSASQVSAGLLHLFHGKSARLAPMARLGLSLTLELIEQMSTFSGRKFLTQTSFLRPARQALQLESFMARAKQHPQEMHFGSHELDGRVFEQSLLIHDAFIVDMPGYLAALEKYLIGQGGHFIDEKADPEKLKSYEKVILASGPHTLSLMQELSKAPLPSSLTTILTKGQVALCESIAPPTQVINARAYVAPLPSTQGTLVGATFERKYDSEEPTDCPERMQIWQEALELWPSLQSAIPKWVSGVRLSGPDHLPFLARQSQELFVLAGLGSKGLLYHRLMAQRLMRLMTRSTSVSSWEIFPLKMLESDYLF